MKPLSSWTDASCTVGRLRAAFDTGALSLTVGVEEELMQIDPDTGRLTPRIDEVLRSVGGDIRFGAELRAAQVEVATRPCLSATDVGRELAVARIELAAAIGEETSLLACGVHPVVSSVGPITDGERYRAIAAENPWAALHMLTCGLHIHVALADGDRALAVYNALRSYLPEFAALSANSPYHASVNTGLASTRLQLNRSLARHGVPPVFADWNRYADFTRWGRIGGSIPDSSHHWWDLRLHPDYGTLEIRVCDAQTHIADTVTLVALAQTLVAWLANRYDAGMALPVHDTHRISESLWLAARTGAPGELLDLDSGERRPTLEHMARLHDELRPFAADLGTQEELDQLPALVRAGGALRQRRLVREHGLEALVTLLADDTVGSARRFLDGLGTQIAHEGAIV